MDNVYHLTVRWDNVLSIMDLVELRSNHQGKGFSDCFSEDILAIVE